MNNSFVQLSFALSSSDDALCAAMAHTMEYEKVTLFADQHHSVTLQCVLPADAHAGDIISISATHPLKRSASYFFALTLTQGDIENHYALLTMSDVFQSGDFVLQLMLHGLHTTLKDSAQFDVYITANEQAFYKLAAPVHTVTLPQKMRHALSNIGTSLLTLF